MVVEFCLAPVDKVEAGFFSQKGWFFFKIILIKYILH